MPRKTLTDGRNRCGRLLASMRPRPDAAENHVAVHVRRMVLQELQ